MALGPQKSYLVYRVTDISEEQFPLEAISPPEPQKPPEAQVSGYCRHLLSGGTEEPPETGHWASVATQVCSAAHADGGTEGCVGPGRPQDNSSSGERGSLRDSASVINLGKGGCKRMAERLRKNRRFSGVRAAGGEKIAVREF